MFLFKNVLIYLIISIILISLFQLPEDQSSIVLPANFYVLNDEMVVELM